MQALVTGVAGFIGSHLAEALLQAGHRVRGVDAFTAYYDTHHKRANLSALLSWPGFELAAVDLRTAELSPLLADSDVVFHLAGQPGVRLSWSDGFDAYSQLNTGVTQRLLEAVKDSDVSRFVLASSSSVYGNAPAYPTVETDLPRPHSPYGVTKLAAEHLCGLYAANYGVPTVSLRYFSVYGPRQRPDMAFHRFCEAALDDKPVPLYGDGSQGRDFTYVSDVVAATMAAGEASLPAGAVLNVASGAPSTMLQFLDLLSELLGREVRVERLPDQAGDVAVTFAGIQRAADLLGWSPRVPLRSGLRAQLDWHRRLRDRSERLLPLAAPAAGGTATH